MSDKNNSDGSSIDFYVRVVKRREGVDLMAVLSSGDALMIDHLIACERDPKKLVLLLRLVVANVKNHGDFYETFSLNPAMPLSVMSIICNSNEPADTLASQASPKLS